MSYPAFACLGSIIIDDIVYPDGRTDMAVLGGGGTHTAAGMSAWDEHPALLAAVGVGLPPEILARLERDYDLTYTIHSPMEQVRAWQIFEWDGRRTEIPRAGKWGEFLLQPRIDQAPSVTEQIGAVSILREADEFVKWRALFPHSTVLWEPEQQFMLPENQASFRAALPHADIVSPNLLEASQIYGKSDAAGLIRRMLDDGAGAVALRMGEAGSLLGKRGQAELILIPAVPVPEVVDVTGAGNAYCGAFLVGWVRSGGDLRAAGLHGAVASSFVIEQVGAFNPQAKQGWQAARAERYAAAERLV